MTKDEEDWNPGRLLALSGGYWSAFVLHAGVVLDVFTAIGSKTIAAAPLARKVGAAPRHLSVLLDALAALGLLKKTRAGYANTPSSCRFLRRGSERYLGHIIRHHHHLAGSWARIDEAVLSGKPLRERASRTSPAQRESFLMGMFNMAMNMGPLIVPKLPLKGRRRLLDLGGGPGTYSALMCRSFPGLEAKVYDLPTTRPFAEKTIARFGMGRRIRFIPGDYVRKNIPGRYDAAWLSHILHGEGPRACAGIVAKAAATLEPGGLLMVQEFLLDDSKDGPLFPALFSINMLLGTAEGRAYSEGEVRGFMAEAGARGIRRLPLALPNGAGVLVGTV